MNSQQRRELIIKKLEQSDKAISAGTLAKEMNVSRQVIVGDIALIRAAGKDILSTPRGYILPQNYDDGAWLTKTIACTHSAREAATELYTIVDNGGGVINVIVEHPLYGELSGELHIYSRHDTDSFLKKVESQRIHLLSNLTEGLHMHTIKCKSEEDFERIKEKLKSFGLLYESSEEEPSHQ